MRSFLDPPPNPANTNIAINKTTIKICIFAIEIARLFVKIIKSIKDGLLRITAPICCHSILKISKGFPCSCSFSPYVCMSVCRVLFKPVRTFDCLSLIQHHILPFYSSEVLFIRNQELVARNENVKSSIPVLKCQESVQKEKMELVICRCHIAQVTSSFETRSFMVYER